MKRPRIYRPRSGVRFDNRRGHGPAGGFIGTELDEVMVITGSVETSLVQVDDRYEFPTVPFAGYPRNGVEFGDVVGSEPWTSGFLCNDLASTRCLTASFGYLEKFSQLEGSQVDYGFPGLRGSRDGDTGILFTGLNIAAFSSSIPAGYDLDLNTDLVFAFVCKARNTFANDSGEILEKDGFIAGYRITTDSGGDNNLRRISFVLGNAVVNENLDQAFNPGNWFILIGSYNRSDDRIRFATKDLSTDEIKISSGSSFGFLSGSDFSSPSSSLIFGGGSSLPDPREFAVSAFFLGSGSYQGFTQEARLVQACNGLANVLRAPQSYLFSGSKQVEDNVGSFGTAAKTRLYNTQIRGETTGGLGYTYRSLTFVVTSSIPSWTNRHLGQSAAFVTLALGSNNHESRVLNYYTSGSELLETTAVPASSPLYYAKSSGTTGHRTFAQGNTLTKKSGLTSGFTFLTGTIDSVEYALAYRITGVLADLSGSAPGWLLNNQFLMPCIPLSSASLVPASSDPVLVIHPQDLLNVRPILDGARRLTDAARDASAPLTLIRQFDAALSGTSS